MSEKDKSLNDQVDVSDEEIKAKMAQIEGNFSCVPNAFGNGIGFCAKSFDENGKLITAETQPSTPKEEAENK